MNLRAHPGRVALDECVAHRPVHDRRERDNRRRDDRTAKKADTEL